MKAIIILLIFFCFNSSMMLSQVERYDSLYTVASSADFNYRNPSFEDKEIFSFGSTYLNLVYEKRDTLNSKSNIVARKVSFEGAGPEIMISDGNYLDLNPSATHYLIVWHSNRNSNLDIFYSLYSDSTWSAPAALLQTPAYEMNPHAADVAINNNRAYFVVHESMGDVYLKILYQGSLIKDTNLSASIDEPCSSPKIKFNSSSRKLYVSFLKVVNSVKRIVINPGTVNTDFSVTWNQSREFVHTNSVDNNGFANAGNFLQGYLTYNYDTLGTSHSLGIDLQSFNKTVFTDQFDGRNYNGTGSLFPIITDNVSTMDFFTTFGWNRKNADSSIIMAHVRSFPQVTKRFYIGDSTVTARPDISDYLLYNQYLIFRIVWEQKIDGRYAIMESRYRDFAGSINEGALENVDFKLNQNYPNPFNPNTKINYELRITGYVVLRVFDVNGKEVKTLVSKMQSAGNYEVEFDGSNLSSGIYFYELKAGDFSQTKRMMHLK